MQRRPKLQKELKRRQNCIEYRKANNREMQRRPKFQKELKRSQNCIEYRDTNN